MSHALKTDQPCSDCISRGNDGRGSLAIYEDSTWCFKCATFRWTNKQNGRSLFDSIANIKSTTDFIELYLDAGLYTRKTCSVVKEYCNSFSVLDDGLRIRYIPQSNSLIFPAFSFDNEGIFRLSGLNIKSLDVNSKCKYKFLGAKRACFMAHNNETNYFVLCEDYISALKVTESTRYTIEGICLFGTSLNDKEALRIISCMRNISGDKKKIIIWLDGDGPGCTASKKIITRLQHLGMPLSQLAEISTPLDPKYYSKDSIIRYIEEVL